MGAYRNNFPIAVPNSNGRVNVRTWVDENLYALMIKVTTKDGRELTREISLVDVYEKNISDVTPYVMEMIKELFPGTTTARFKDKEIEEAELALKELKPYAKSKGYYIGLQVKDKKTLVVRCNSIDYDDEGKKKSSSKLVHPSTLASPAERLSSIIDELINETETKKVVRC